MADGADFIQDGHLRALMRAAQDGDRQAYEILLRTIAPVLRRFLMSRTGTISGQELEDLVQDILLSMHQARRTYDPERPFLPWLLAIARHRLAEATRESGMSSIALRVAVHRAIKALRTKLTKSEND